MSDVVIKVENLSKQYRLGLVGTGTFAHDLNRWWCQMRGKEDPYLKVGESNDRTSKGLSEYVWALRDVNFEVKRGEVLGIIGRNGAGKSTLLKILSRVTAPTVGSVKGKGRIASLLEVGTGFHPELTGRENIYLNGAILGMSRSEIQSKFDEIVTFSEVEKYIDTPVKRYSSGMYVRLAFGVAAHLEPEILIVDEVLAVGDTAFQNKCLGKMDDVARHGRTVLFVSHNMAAVSQLTKRSLLLKYGYVSFDGPTEIAVRKYLDERKTTKQLKRTPTVDIVCDHQWVTNPVVKIIEIGLAEGQNNEIGVGDNLKLEILLEAEKPCRKLRIGYSVNDNTTGTVLTGFSPEFDVPREGVCLYKLNLQQLNLAPGEYSLSMSIGTGGLLENKNVYHGILGFCFFSVKSSWQEHVVSDWHNGWGRVVHLQSEISINHDQISENG